jgi:hypothetical protein
MRCAEWVLAGICFLGLSASGEQSPKKGVQGLPNGVVKAMTGAAKDYCDQWVGSYRSGCRDKFRRNLLWRRLTITPSGEEAIVVENHNMGACGSAGCSLFLFTKAANGNFTQILGTQGDIGTVTQVRVLKSVTSGHYDLQKTWADKQTTTLYRWNMTRYMSTE